MQRRQISIATWIDIAIFMGPLPNTDYLFVIVDNFSIKIKIMKTITSANTIKASRETFAGLYFPISITSDNGK